MTKTSTEKERHWFVSHQTPTGPRSGGAVGAAAPPTFWMGVPVYTHAPGAGILY